MNAMEDGIRAVLDEPIMRSRLMETEPVGVPDPQPWYLNRIISGEYGASAQRLLVTCMEIEQKLGRSRIKPLAPRTADIDILLFGNDYKRSHNLIIPHPQITDRHFILEGLHEILPEFILPGIGKPIGEIVKEMPDSVRAQKIHFITENENGKES